MAHNTMECCKYEKDGTTKKSFAGKSMQCALCSKNMTLTNNSIHDHNSVYVKLSVKIAKLKSLTGNSSTPERSTSMITTVTVKTLTHPEVMDMAALGN